MRRLRLVLPAVLIAFLHLATNCAARPGVVDIAVTSDGSIYVLDAWHDEVIKLNAAGDLAWRKSLISEGMPANGQKSYQTGTFGFLQCYDANGATGKLYLLSSLVGIRSVSPDGDFSAVLPPMGAKWSNVFGADSNLRVFFVNATKNRIERYVRESAKPITLEQPGPLFPRGQSLPCDLVIDGSVAGPSHFARPSNVFVSPSGDRIWVRDQTFSFKIFDGDGKYLFTVKAPDKNNRSFTVVYGISFDKTGNAYVGCCEARSIQKYDSRGKLVGEIPFEDPKKYGVTAFGMDAAGQIYLYNCLLNAIVPIDSSGKQLRVIPVPE